MTYIKNLLYFFLLVGILTAAGFGGRWILSYQPPVSPAGRAIAISQNEDVNGTRQGFESAEVFYTYGFAFDKIVPANDQDMALPEGPLVKFRDGTLVMDPSGQAGGQAYFIISSGQKRRFLSVSQLQALGYNPENLINASLSLYTEGQAVE